MLVSFSSSETLKGWICQPAVSLLFILHEANTKDIIFMMKKGTQRGSNELVDLNSIEDWKVFKQMSWHTLNSLSIWTSWGQNENVLVNFMRRSLNLNNYCVKWLHILGTHKRSLGTYDESQTTLFFFLSGQANVCRSVSVARHHDSIF